MLRNAGAAAGATNGRLISLSQFLEVLDADGTFAPAGAGETTASVIDRFRIRASSYAPVEVPIYCKLIISGPGCQDTILVPIIVGDSTNLPVGPDLYGYQIYDWTDSCYDQLPDYNWYELRGVGTRLTSGDDETQSIELPLAFGNWVYYGVPYRHISICSNGWVAADTTSRCDFVNVELPYHRAPPNIVAFLWDDLAPSRYGAIWYYYDTIGHRFIVEFDSISYFGMPDRWEKVQVQIFDTTVSTPTGDNPIVISFKTANDLSSVTIGLQNQDGSSGLTYLWDGRYPRTAAPLEPERSLWIEAGQLTGTPEEIRGATPQMVGVYPNPFRTRTKIVLAISERTINPLVTVYQVNGRAVRRLYPSGQEKNVFFWDGRDENGVTLNPGVYFIKVSAAPGDNKAIVKKVILVP